jgi:hypothetical protein
VLESDAAEMLYARGESREVMGWVSEGRVG